jgi:hypothetical protein
MALLGNYTVFNNGPGRWLGGTSTAHASGIGSAQVGTRANWGKTGARRNFAFQDRSTGALEYFSVPDGYGGRSYVIPIEAGGLSSHDWLVGIATLIGAGALGKNAEALINANGTLTATGQLVVSGVASLAGTGSISATVLAALLGSATLSGTGSVTGTAVAKGFVVANLSGTGTLTATRYATGALAAEITPFTELSPQSLAEAVWTRATDGAYTTEELLRLIASAAAGKVSGASGTTITIRNLADTLNRIVATVDSSGNRSAITYDLGS